MGKEKDVSKKVLMPSTTRRCTDLPTKPHFSPNAPTTLVIGNKATALLSSLVSRMSTNTEIELLDDGSDKHGRPIYLRIFPMMI
jgi:hypothetical protein